MGYRATEDGLYKGREVFAHAPLVYVAAEIRLAYEPDIIDQESRNAFAQHVRDVLPVLRHEVQQSEPMSNDDGEMFRESVPLLRASSVDGTTAASLGVQALTVETVNYSEFKEFSELLGRTLEALAVAAPRARLTRLGLRYIDEVRVPSVERSSDWSEWLAPELTSPLGLAPGYEIGGISGSLVLPREDSCKVFFRWGEVLGSTVISSDANLNVPRPPDGRFFVLDVDSAWEPPETQLATDIDMFERFDHLHEPIGVMFMSALTEKVKRVFRGEGQE